MNIQEILDKLKIKDILDDIIQKLGLSESLPKGVSGSCTEEEINSYLEMAYGLYFSRGLKDGETKWAINKERLANYIEFHLNKPCNSKALSVVLNYLMPYGRYDYSFPKDESKLSKLNQYSSSNNYKYSRDLAYSIVQTELKDFQSLTDLFCNEIAKKYYLIIYGLLSSVKKDSTSNGITKEGIQKYLEAKLGEKYDEEVFSRVIELFSTEKAASYTLTNNTLYHTRDNAKLLYVNRIVFGCNTTELELAEDYTCCAKEAYHICYPEIIKKIDAEYQNVLDVVASCGVTSFKAGIDKIVNEYEGVIGYFAIREYIHKVTKDKFFEGNPVVESILDAYLVNSLWSAQNPHGVASVALRTVHFEKYGHNEEEYVGITEEECHDIIRAEESIITDTISTLYSGEKAIEKATFHIMNKNILNADIFGRFWMPFECEVFYTDMLCNLHWKKLAQINDFDVSQDALEIYNIIFASIELSDEERQRREEKKQEEQRRYAERQREREAERKRVAEAEAAAREKEAAERSQRQVQERKAQEERTRHQQEEARRQQEEAKRREEDNKNIYYYCFGPFDYDGVNVISNRNNVWAAKMAMLRTYGKTEADIKFYIAGERKDCSNYFDGRSFN